MSPRAILLARRTVAVGLFAAIVWVVFVTVGRIGFNPTDDGNLLAQTRRILQGQVPHRDFVFARPMGSALFHMIDYALPMPLFEASRLVGIAEILGYSLLFARLIYRRPITSWSFAMWAAAIASAAVNAHTYPLFAWYTTDGLLFTAAGWVLIADGLESAKPRRALLGMAMTGLAVLMKQSFFLAPLVGLIFILRARRQGVRGPGSYAAVASAAIPGVAYVAALAPLGGVADLFDQVIGVTPVWGVVVVNAFAFPHGIGRALAMGTLLSVILVVIAYLVERRAAARAPRASDVAPWIALVIYSAAIPVSARYEYLGMWGIQLFWTSLVIAAGAAAAMRRVDPVATSILLAAWMASLSWGYELPHLVVGSLGLAVLVTSWRAFGSGWRHARRVVTATAVVTGVIVAATWVSAAREDPYLAPPARYHTEEIRSVSAEFGDIRVDPVTAAYLRAIRTCIQSYPASRVAVLPDNPGAYPALDLTNPFPIDWMYPEEARTAEDRIRSVAQELSTEGDFLVLFQIFEGRKMETLPVLPSATPTSRIEFYDEALGPFLYEALGGTEIVCGPFRGRYQPGGT